MTTSMFPRYMLVADGEVKAAEGRRPAIAWLERHELAMHDEAFWVRLGCIAGRDHFAAIRIAQVADDQPILLSDEIEATVWPDREEIRKAMEVPGVGSLPPPPPGVIGRLLIEHWIADTGSATQFWRAETAGKTRNANPRRLAFL